MLSKMSLAESAVNIWFKKFVGLLIIYRSVRFSSVLCFTSATFAGAVLAGAIFDLKMVWLIIFSASSTAFGFIINDLSDAELDKLDPIPRNPVSTGDLTFRRCVAASSFLVLFSLMSLFTLNKENQFLGMVVLYLYFTYSWLVRAKAHPPLDLVYHGLCPAVLAIMGWRQYKPLDTSCLLLASVVFLLSSISQILQEIRDYKTDSLMIKTTVTKLGKRKSLVLCLIFFASAFFLFIPLLFNGVFPLQILFLSPLAYFVVSPIIKALRGEVSEKTMLEYIERKRLILIAILVVALIISCGIL